MAEREQIRKQLAKDNIEFLLAQFVDIHGAAKVKMVPIGALDSMIDEGVSLLPSQANFYWLAGLVEGAVI